MPPAVGLLVGGERFDIPQDVVEVIEPASVLSEALREAAGGAIVSVPRSAALFSGIMDFVISGALPNDIVALRDLYVESAFWRLSTLRDAIESALATGGDDGAPAVVERFDHSPAQPLRDSTVTAGPNPMQAAVQFRPPHPTVMSAALAISRADAVRRAGITPPRANPATPPADLSAARSPPVGLSTSEYVGGAWRKLYAPPAPMASSFSLTTSGAADGAWSSSTLGAAASRTSALNPNTCTAVNQRGTNLPTTAFEEAADTLERAAARTALPDPFGFMRKRADPAFAERSSALVLPPPPRSDALAMSISSLSMDGDNLRGCLSTLTALNSLLASRAALRSDEDGDAVGDGFRTNRSTQVTDGAPLSLSPAALKIEAPTATRGHAAIDAARALLAALESDAPAPEAPQFASLPKTASETLDRTSPTVGADLASAATNAALAALRFGAAAAEAAMDALALPDDS